ncbi:MAG: aminotransferase class IV [Candidatus Gracilibacteria bacterium]
MEPTGEVHVHEETLPKWSGKFLFDETWRVKFVEGERALPGIKHLDTSFQVGEREKASKEGVDEIVMVSPDGFVREGGITNIFFWDGKKLITPASGMLLGIGRSLVIRFARENGIIVEERDVKFEEIKKGLGEFFLVNSIRGIVPAVGAEGIIEKLSALIGNFISQKIEERRYKIHRNN